MYKIILTDAYYEFNEKDGVYDWPDKEFDSKKVEEHETIQACLDSMAEWGSKWVMYPSVVIENEEGEEVYSSYASHKKCSHCGHEEWSNIETDLRSMKALATGKPLFPNLK